MALSGERPTGMLPDHPDDHDLDAILTELGFEPDEHHLTRRQAEVLVLREHGLQQQAIADRLGCSRANVASIERSARSNVAKARATVEFAELLASPVRVDLPAGLDLYDVPDRIYAACDEHDIKVRHGAPELIRCVSDGAPTSITDGAIVEPVAVLVGPDGTVDILPR